MHTPIAFSGIVFDRRGRVLLVRPDLSTDEKTWAFPRGVAPDPIELPEHAAARAVAAHAGIRAVAVALLPGFFFAQGIFTHYFLMIADEERIGEAASGGGAIARWFAADEARALLAPGAKPERGHSNLDLLDEADAEFSPDPEWFTTCLKWAARRANPHDNVNSPPITQADIDELTAFLPKFETAGRTFAKWHGLDQTGSIRYFPWPEYEEDVARFFNILGRNVWSDFGYSPEASRFMVETDHLRANANLAMMRSIFTWCCRGERFCDGHREALLKEGVIVNLLRRMEQLREFAAPSEPCDEA